MEKENNILRTEYQSSEVWQHEDAVIKISMQFFADELLPYFNIEGKVISFAPTELVHLELQKLFQDFNLVMEDGTWKHFEFQSTNEGLIGLKRFRAYESLTSYHHKVVVETYVLFSGNIKNPMTEFTEGFNTYRIKPIIMQNYNADEFLAKLEQKQNNGETIIKEDLIPLVLCPLMGGESATKDRINKAYRIIRKTTDVKKEDTAKIEAMLYAMADKFLDVVDLEKLKEEIAMTRLGQMIWEEGRESMLLELIQDGLLTIKDAAIRLSISEEEVKKLLEEKRLKQL